VSSNGSGKKSGKVGGRGAVLLAGLRGSGKSTAGRLLADRLGRPFVDLDDATLARLGMGSVESAWATLGEPAFRAAELEALAEAIELSPDAVVALGGGTPMIDGFEDVARGRASVVYLHAAPAALRARVRDGDPARPPLMTEGTGEGMGEGASAVEEIEAVYARRDPVYRRLAKRVVEAGGTVRETAEGLAGVCGAG